MAERTAGINLLYDQGREPKETDAEAAGLDRVAVWPFLLERSTLTRSTRLEKTPSAKWVRRST
jgi:hypothetical protein